ncbi:hypothetical protein CEXT_311221 [Caerostris extrusa]|uniref:Uncharacterized protein n=1 Tax=Caerostris extrusa TaxID=172846 RepID=A0AAV4SQJ3_CAEEX|nr:hypothetical protein CEXT_311221 [Caerostris extrusa]
MFSEEESSTHYCSSSECRSCAKKSRLYWVRDATAAAEGHSLAGKMSPPLLVRQLARGMCRIFIAFIYLRKAPAGPGTFLPF